MGISRPRLLVLSHVLPFPHSAGQQQRVFYTLEAARKFFEITFLTSVSEASRTELTRRLAGLCDEVILIPSRYSRNRVWNGCHGIAGALYAIGAGLKASNYMIGRVEFSPARLAPLLVSRDFDCVLFEYWHAFAATGVFQARGIPCVLDMHDILWRSYARQLEDKPFLPAWAKRWAVHRYKVREERAWTQFDGVTAINREEYRYLLRSGMPEAPKLFYAPMGVDLKRWPYSWRPAAPVRLAYYGGLGSPHNQQDALRCHRRIMPKIWERYGNAELWLVGSHPPSRLRALTSDARVKVPGFVEDVQSLLATMSCVLCPWSGTYGFRSRLVEVMALGVPTIATPDAVYGMELEDGQGVLLGNDDETLSRRAIQLLEDEEFAMAQSRLGRQRVERLYDVEKTYGRWMRELSDWLTERQSSVSGRRSQVAGEV